MEIKGKTHCKHGHAYTEKTVYRYKDRVSVICKHCRALSAQKFYNNNSERIKEARKRNEN